MRYKINQSAVVARVLAFLFPPKLPGRVEGWQDRVEAAVPQESGQAGPARRKQYRNGIERHFAENS
jgi:hypothetical protein